MGARKRVQKIPKNVNVKCSKCGKNNRIDVPLDRLVNCFQCRHCGEITLTPIASCCIVCAFTKYRCPMNLLIEAKAKNLEVRMPESKSKQERKIFTREDFEKGVFG